MLRSSRSSAPIQSPAAQRASNTASPAQAGARGALRGLLGVEPRGGAVVAALRLDEQAVQAEQPGVVARRHGVEGALGRLAVAGELRRLRAEQQRERLVRRDPRRLVGEPARGAHVAGADRDQALRHREIAAHAAARAQIEPQDVGRAQDRAQRSTTAALSAQRPRPPPTTSTITEVSIRSFCQVITTSPGRSASQTAPTASKPTITR